MKIIRMNRGQGKSVELIKLSSEKWYYILCMDKRRARSLVAKADEMGLEIPYPITVAELPIHSPYVRGLLIDDVDYVLQKLVGIPDVIQCTTSCEIDDREIEESCEKIPLLGL